MGYSVKGECRNTGRTHLKKGHVPWNKGLRGIHSQECLEENSRKAKERLLRNGHPFKGKHHTKETKKKIKETLIKRFEGKPKHNGIVYQNSFWRELRKLIYKRDGYKCQECGKKANGRRSLHAHHIDFDPKNNDFLNLITLCPSCHGKTHNKRIDWINYYSKKIKNVT